MNWGGGSASLQRVLSRRRFRPAPRLGSGVLVGAGRRTGSGVRSRAGRACHDWMPAAAQACGEVRGADLVACTDRP